MAASSCGESERTSRPALWLVGGTRVRSAGQSQFDLPHAAARLPLNYHGTIHSQKVLYWYKARTLAAKRIAQVTTGRLPTLFATAAVGRPGNGALLVTGRRNVQTCSGPGWTTSLLATRSFTACIGDGRRNMVGGNCATRSRETHGLKRRVRGGQPEVSLLY